MRHRRDHIPTSNGKDLSVHIMRHGRNERNRNKNRATHQCGRESERHKICAHLFPLWVLDVSSFFALAYHSPLGTTATLPVHSQPLVGDFFGLPTSCNCVDKHLSVWFFLHVKTLHILIPTCKFLCPCRKLRHFLLSPRRSCAYLVRTLLLKTRLSFAQSLAFLYSTRCSFRGLLEQHHVSTKLAKDEVTKLTSICFFQDSPLFLRTTRQDLLKSRFFNFQATQTMQLSVRFPSS